MAKVSTVAHAVAEVVAPAPASGSGLMVRANVAVAGVQGPLLTFMVRVMTPPADISVVPKVYVGVVELILVKEPLPLLVQETVPLVYAYPAGII
jgi:hypothetical protein